MNKNDFFNWVQENQEELKKRLDQIYPFLKD